ncbi:MAG: precorrin-6Y C5,15-methyltransferase (decarboxylating) subunit CbiT [Hungatella sp.]|nr:precorrin-6Y C5,15-methyltransferase (decarboxylating) subunit CbiT [Hungatella sp.]
MRDEWFIRGNVPMTKCEVRAVAIAKLELRPDSILYDVGAGTGSVSIEAALQMRKGRVYAVERNEEAVDLILANKKKFHGEQVTVIHGSAPESLVSLPVPTHVFLGGSGGKMEPVIKLVLEKNPSVRIVANVIALESLCRILSLTKALGLSAEVVSVWVARGERKGNCHLMKGQNPVYIISMGGADQWEER